MHLRVRFVFAWSGKVCATIATDPSHYLDSHCQLLILRFHFEAIVFKFNFWFFHIPQVRQRFDVPSIFICEPSYRTMLQQFHFQKTKTKQRKAKERACKNNCEKENVRLCPNKRQTLKSLCFRNLKTSLMSFEIKWENVDQRNLSKNNQQR